MKKILVAILILAALFALSAYLVSKKDIKKPIDYVSSKFTEAEIEKPKASQNMTSREEAIEEAYRIYEVHVTEGTDFSRGPCLSNRLIPNWVLDIAHEPRTAVDNDPANQCAAYREGRAEHFVELDPEGKLIQAE